MNAVRALLGRRPPPPPERAHVEPFVGEYRTRPWEPPPPPPPIVPARRLRKDSLFLFLGSVAFVAVGVWMAVAGRDPSDRFWGICSAGFFGLCACVPLEQLLTGQDAAALPRAGAARMLAGMFLLGFAGVYLAWTFAGIHLVERLFCGVSSAAFIGLALWGAVVAHRNGRLFRRSRPRAGRSWPPSAG